MMATDRLELFKKRRRRVRNKLRKINKDLTIAKWFAIMLKQRRKRQTTLKG